MPQLWGLDTRKSALNTGGDVPSDYPSSGGSKAPELPPGFGFTDKYGQNPFATPDQFAASLGATPVSNTPKALKKGSPEWFLDQISQYYSRKNKGLDFSDPRVQSILNQARNSTLQSANDRGIFGGYSENAAEGSYIKAAAGLQQQDDMLALNALGMGSGYSRGLSEDQYQADLNKYMMDKESGGDLGSLIGGGLGALGGGLLGIPGGLAGIAAGAGAGWNFGSGIGGQFGSSNSGARPPRWGGGY